METQPMGARGLDQRVAWALLLREVGGGNIVAYREDPGYTQVWVDTRMTEDELEDWLYRAKGIDYVGVWQRREDQIAA